VWQGRWPDLHAHFWISRCEGAGFAEKLGLAFQLTNIIRDVREDCAIGRVYLPEEDLAPLRRGECGFWQKRSHARRA